MQSLHHYRKMFNKYADDQLRGKSPSALYEPITYTMDAAGKRIRPILCLMGCHLFGEKIAKALPAAFAVEIFHNFTLLHDDIMDKADTRRGKPSVYVQYGTPTAILSGDAMMIYAYQYLTNYESANKVMRLVQVFTDNAIGVCEGQQLDMDFEQAEEVSIDQYLEMITKKTSILLGAALQMGAIIADAGPQDQKHLYNFGKYAGIAFQIHDDYLDVFGDQEKVGKMIAGDIVNNKKTYLYLKALEQATSSDRTQLLSLYHPDNTINPEHKVKTVQNIFKNYAVQEWAKQLEEAYLDLAISHLEAIEGSEPVKKELTLLAKYFIAREY